METYIREHIELIYERNINGVKEKLISLKGVGMDLTISQVELFVEGLYVTVERQRGCARVFINNNDEVARKPRNIKSVGIYNYHNFVL